MAKEFKERTRQTSEYFKQKVYNEDERKKDAEERRRKFHENMTNMRDKFSSKMNEGSAKFE